MLWADAPRVSPQHNMLWADADPSERARCSCAINRCVGCNICVCNVDLRYQRWHFWWLSRSGLYVKCSPTSSHYYLQLPFVVCTRFVCVYLTCMRRARSLRRACVRFFRWFAHVCFCMKGSFVWVVCWGCPTKVDAGWAQFSSRNTSGSNAKRRSGLCVCVCSSRYVGHMYV